jgi:hypothetical protein
MAGMMPEDSNPAAMSSPRQSSAERSGEEWYSLDASSHQLAL